MRLEREFAASLPEQALASSETPRDLLRFLLASAGQAPKAADRTLASLVQAEGVRPPDAARTLTEALEYHAQRQPERLTVHLYEEGDEKSLTYRALWDGALLYAARLAEAGGLRDPRHRVYAGARHGWSNRLPAVHLGQHRQPERRGAHAREPAREREGHGQSGARHHRRRVRELAAALPRHGPHRRLLRDDVSGLPGGADVAARLPVAAEPMAARHPSPPRHHFGRPQLLLRAVPAAHSG